MNKSVSFFIAGIMIGVLFASWGFAVYINKMKMRETGNRPVVLKLGHGLEPTHPVHLAMEEMKKNLEEYSGGQVTIDIYPSGVIGSEVHCIEQLQNGSLAMTKTSTAAMEAFIPEMAVFSLPYIFRDHEHYWNVLNSEVGRELLENGREKFLVGLCYYDAGSRNFYTVDKQVLTPDDLKGLKIRVMNSRTSMDMVEALGGAPTPISWGELYSALAQGTVDGAENNPPSYVSNKHYEVAKYFTMDGHSRIPDILMMSTKVWETLTPQQQEWLQQAADDSSVFQRELWARKTKEYLDSAEAELGVTVYYPDQSLFKAKCLPLLESYEGTEIGSLLNRIGEVE